jgi:hypothetical protein
MGTLRMRGAPLPLKAIDEDSNSVIRDGTGSKCYTRQRNIILALLGIGFILGGLSILTGFEIEWRILGGALIILLGIWFIILAMRAIASSKSS